MQENNFAQRVKLSQRDIFGKRVIFVREKKVICRRLRVTIKVKIIIPNKYT